MVRRRAQAAGMLVLALAGAAHANGRLPSAISTNWQDGDTPRVVIGASFGALVSTDAAQSFRWICEPALGYGGFFDPEYALSAGGIMYASTFNGLARSEDGGCSWGFSFGDLAGYYVDGFALDPRDPSVVFAATGSNGKANAIMRSSDGGRSFTVLPATSRASRFYKSLRFAPSDPLRLYAGGHVLTPPSASLWVSRDAGGSFVEAPFTPGGTTEFRVMAVNPVNADILFVRTQLATGSPWLLYRSDDAGGSWTQVLSSPDRINAVSLSGDGLTAMVAANPGAFRSTDGGQHWVPLVMPPHLFGTSAHGADLYGCATDFLDGFAVGVSHDFGLTWSKVFRLKELVGVLDCPEGAVASWLPTPQSTDVMLKSRATRELCDPLWRTTALQIGVFGQDSGLEPDAGKPPESPSGCGCRAAESSGNSAGWAGLMGLVIGALALVRRSALRSRHAPRETLRPALEPRGRCPGRLRRWWRRQWHGRRRRDSGRARAGARHRR